MNLSFAKVPQRRAGTAYCHARYKGGKQVACETRWDPKALGRKRPSRVCTWASLTSNLVLWSVAMALAAKSIVGQLPGFCASLSVCLFWAMGSLRTSENPKRFYGGREGCRFVV